MSYQKLLTVMFVTMVTVLLMSGTADAKKPCRPAKNMISCLIDRCTLGLKCPSDPTAKCKMIQTKCDGCKAVWISKTGEQASCGLRKNLKLCPGGEPIVKCKLDLCNWPCTHPDFKMAKCRKTFCGECGSEYFVKGKWVKCPVKQDTKTGTSIKTSKATGVCNKVACSIAVCIGQRCPKVPRAVCRPNDCNMCTPEWFLDNRPVNCNTGELIAKKPLVISPIKPWQKPCEKGIPLTKCDMKVCESKVCRNFPNAQCRPDGCGGCKDTWYIGDKLIDCYSDECPPKVPIVKCVDDPCKYFGHYCPAAECRASQCGKCEAKFFVNGQEIDCAMPPKECPLGVTPLKCPYYTCPANICPSNTRLMCRIDPCGRTCRYDFIDIYNGEPMLCRVFDGDGRHLDNAGQTTNQNVGIDSSVINPPLLGDIVGDPEVLGLGLPQSFNTKTTPNKDNFVGDKSFKPAGVTLNTDSNFGGSGNNINVQPLFLNPGPPITDPDLLSLLRSFPHEMANIPSAMIQSAIKKNKGIQAATVKAQPKPPRTILVKKPKVDTKSKASPNVGDNIINKQLFELSPIDSVLYPELSALAGKPLKGITGKGKSQKQSKGSGIAAKNVKNSKAKPTKKTTNPLGVMVSQPLGKGQGIPISIGLFSIWAMT